MSRDLPHPLELGVFLPIMRGLLPFQTLVAVAVGGSAVPGQYGGVRAVSLALVKRERSQLELLMDL